MVKIQRVAFKQLVKRRLTKPYLLAIIAKTKANTNIEVIYFIVDVLKNYYCVEGGSPQFFPYIVHISNVLNTSEY